VAYRTALHVRAHRTSRQAHEQRANQRQPADPLDEITGRELLAVLDEEVQRLPGRYRLRVLLCYLEGQTHEQAAQELGWSRSTVKRRLEQARKRLQSRLTRRGLALGGVLLTTHLAQPTAPAAVSAPLAAATVQAAMQLTTGKMLVAGALSAPLAGLTEAVLHSLFVTKLKSIAAWLVAVGVLAL